MNNARRKALATLQVQLQELKGKIDDIRSEAETLRDEEQEAFDNLPESLQDADRGQTMQTAIDAMDEIVTELESAVDTIEQLDAKFDEAAE